ncbi:hypothetical protein PGTUg99_035310 [Puccinia graminis f. sp. tritici]|uniref:Uncharacterized protein n=1 Tax=Puccinia graminis f. sp. tritici TaxID=56615 RepID=A0A5B0SG93_PUCGR|nr:hypothetical protein PGTUg99_035310 [Puccinia graminis f. sp. tritici]
MEDRAEVKEEADEIGEGESKTLWPIMTAQFIISSADPRLSNHHHHHQSLPPEKRTDPNRQSGISLSLDAERGGARAGYIKIVCILDRFHRLQNPGHWQLAGNSPADQRFELSWISIGLRLHRPHGQSRADERSSLASLGPIIVLLIKLHAHHLPCLNKKNPLCLLISAFFYPSTSHHHPASIDASSSTATDIL